jgi:hypothetical protein
MEDLKLLPWYVRYPGSVAVGYLFFHDVAVLDRNLQAHFWGSVAFYVLIIGFILVLTHEVSRWVIGLGLAAAFGIWVINGLQNLTVPGAILVGAAIIAAAVWETRR